MTDWTSETQDPARLLGSWDEPPKPRPTTLPQAVLLTLVACLAGLAGGVLAVLVIDLMRR